MKVQMPIQSRRLGNVAYQRFHKSGEGPSHLLLLPPQHPKEGEYAIGHVIERTKALKLVGDDTAVFSVV